MFKFSFIKSYFKRNLIIWKIGLLTGLVMVLFEMVNLFVVYRNIRLDYYLSLVAILFLIIGIWVNKNDIRTQIVSSSRPLLTMKEMQILQLVAAGKTNKEIASVQFIEVSTVKTHLNN